MFYSTNVLQKKGPLGAIWIAAHHDVAKKLTKLQILNTDIVKTAGQIENPEMEMSLRLSSHLLAGLSRIYTRKVQFLFTDCNEALSKITLAFRPSNVDLGPVNKAQIKSITIDESALAHMDLDLELDFQDAEWLAPQTLTSQSSAAEITLPDVSVRQRAASNTWDDEDALLGGGWGAGDNPLDLAFEDAEGPRFENEAPEKHRSSDQVRLEDTSKIPDDQDIPDAPEMPEFDMEADIPMARPSDVLSMSLPATPGIRSLDESSVLGLEGSTPVIGVKKAKQANKKRKAPVSNQGTEVPKEEMRRWIMSPELAKALTRQPRSLPLNAQLAQKALNDDLKRKKQLAEFMIAQPLLGYVGSRLRETLFDGDAFERDQMSKKRKDRDDGFERVEDEGWQGNGVADLYPDGADAGWPDDDADFSKISNRPSRQGDEDVRDSALDNVDTAEFGDEILPEDETNQQAIATEQQERTKKVVLMLQKHFKTAGSNKTLQFSAMIRSEASAPPSRHMAAVAFFECLGLCAKGTVNLVQNDAFADISISSTPSLAAFKVSA